MTDLNDEAPPSIAEMDEVLDTAARHDSVNPPDAAAEFARMGARSASTLDDVVDDLPAVDNGAPLDTSPDVEGDAAELAALRTWKVQFGAAFRAWRLAFIGLDVVKTGPPGADITPGAGLELICRARMVDGIAFILDGRALGLEAAASNAVRGLLGDPEMAQVNAQLAAFNDEQASAPEGSLTRDLVNAHRELAHLQSELPERSEARDTIAMIMDPRRQLTRTDPAGNVEARDLREAPEVLARQLAVGDKVPSELVARAYEAAGLLVNNRMARK